MGNDENTGCEKSVVIWLIIGVLAIVFANIATIEVAAISVCGLLIIWLLYYLSKRISNKKKLIKVMVVTIGILSAITLVIVFCGNFFLEHHKLILVAILVSAFIVFVIWHIYKNSKEKEIEQEKQIEQGKKTEQDTTTFIHTEYYRIIKEYPLGLKEWNKTIVNKPIDNYEKLVVYNVNKIKQLEQLMMNYNRIKAFFPLGYDEWYRNLPANKATNCIEWAVKEEQIIKQLEQDYLDKIKKENEAKIAREKEIRQQQEKEQLQKLLSEYKHITSEFPYGFSKWRNSHSDLSDTERVFLAIIEKDKIIQLEEEHLKEDYDKIVEQYPHGWHEWERTIKKDEIESFLCLVVKNEKIIKQLEDEWQELNEKIERSLNKLPICIDNLPESERFQYLSPKRQRDDVLKHYADKDCEFSKLSKRELSWIGEKKVYIPYYYFYHYFSKKQFPDLYVDDVLEKRQIIYNFKAGRTFQYNNIITKLKMVFDYHREKLTFVCIPASTVGKTKMRYKAFMEYVCRETGMENGYNHIIITGEGESHHGGGSGCNYECDRGFFKDKLVIVFDDVVTKGDTLKVMVRKLETAGAKVMAAFFLGQTFYGFNYRRVEHPWECKNRRLPTWQEIYGEDDDEEVRDKVEA